MLAMNLNCLCKSVYPKNEMDMNVRLSQIILSMPQVRFDCVDVRLRRMRRSLSDRQRQREACRPSALPKVGVTFHVKRAKFKCSASFATIFL